LSTITSARIIQALGPDEILPQISGGCVDRGGSKLAPPWSATVERMTEPTDHQPGAPPVQARPELLDLYKVAVDEYHFQATFNWSRAQYWMVFNSGILIAGTALLTVPGRSVYPVVVFLVGAVASLLSMRAVQVAHSRYYRAARGRVKRFEELLSIPNDLQFDTTTGFTGRQRPKVNVSAVTYLLLTVLAVADITGAVAALLSPVTAIP
jgi:hypothetical protein